MSEFTFDAKKHAYTLDGKPLMGVTSVLGVIAKPALIQWAADMACEFIRGADSHSEEVLAEARLAHRRKKEAAGEKGTDLHSQVEEYVKWCIENSSGYPVMEWYTNPRYVGKKENPMMEAFVDWASTNTVRFLASEKRVYSREWWVAGTADLVFEKDGKRFVGDVKTMKKIWDRTPFFQMAAYAKMLAEHGEPVDGTCIINIPKEKPEVEAVFSYRLERDISCFEAALALYNNLENDK